MPYYGQPIGVPGIEEVGFGYNKAVLTGLLREKYGLRDRWVGLLVDTSDSLAVRLSPADAR